MRSPAAVRPREAFALLLAFLLAITCIPSGAFATERAPQDGSAPNAAETSDVDPVAQGSTLRDAEAEGDLSAEGDDSAAAAEGPSSEGADDAAAPAAPIAASEAAARTVVLPADTLSRFSVATITTGTVELAPEAEGEVPTLQTTYVANGSAYVLDCEAGEFALANAANAELAEEGYLVVPSGLILDGETYPVTAVAAGAFSGTEAPLVALPSSITHIDGSAFEGCDALQVVYVSPSNESYSSFDGCLYERSADETLSLMLIPGGMEGAVRIPSGAKVEDPEVFSHCASVEAIIVDAGSAAFATPTDDEDIDTGAEGTGRVNQLVELIADKPSYLSALEVIASDESEAEAWRSAGFRNVTVGALADGAESDSAGAVLARPVRVETDGGAAASTDAVPNYAFAVVSEDAFAPAIIPVANPTHATPTTSADFIGEEAVSGEPLAAGESELALTNRNSSGASNRTFTLYYWQSNRWNSWGTTAAAAYLRQVYDDSIRSYSFQVRAVGSTSWGVLNTGSRWPYLGFSADGSFIPFELNTEYEVTSASVYISQLANGTDYANTTFNWYYWDNTNWNNRWGTRTGAWIRQIANPDSPGSCIFQIRSSRSSTWTNVATGSHWRYISFSATGPFKSFELDTAYPITGSNLYMSMLPGGTDYLDRTFQVKYWSNNTWNNWMGPRNACCVRQVPYNDNSYWLQYRSANSTEWKNHQAGSRWPYMSFSATGPFVAFDLNKEYEVQGDVLYMSQYPEGAATTYSVSWNGNGATLSKTGDTVANGRTASVPTRSGMSGWTFGGWYENQACTGTAAISATATATPAITSAKTYYAKWTRSVSFSYQDKASQTTASKIGTKNYGAAVTTVKVDSSLADPTRSDGWAFQGWNASATADAAGVKNITTSTSLPAYAYYARWSKTLSYNAGTGASVSPASGTIWSSSTAPYGSKAGASALPTPTRAGYTFAGWYANADCTGERVDDGTGAAAGKLKLNAITSQDAIYAKWTENTYYIEVAKQAGVSLSSEAKIPVKATAPTVLLPDVSLAPGYSFGGWILAAGSGISGSHLALSNGTSLSGARLTATIQQSWNDGATIATVTAAATPSTYDITWDANGGANGSLADDVKRQTFGSDIKLPPNPTRRGYAFKGWWTEKAGGSQVGPGQAISQVEARPNPVYFAHWEEVPGKIILSSGGGSFDQSQINAFNAVAGNPSAALRSETEVEVTYTVDTESFSFDGLRPTLIGSAFLGWSPTVASPSWDSSSEAYADAAYVATWKANSYSVAYEGWNETLGKEAAFAGWSYEASDLLAAFNEADFEDDGLFALPAIGEMEKRGYRFVKWTRKDTGEEVASIPKVSHDVTIVAHFAAEPYEVKVDLDGGSAGGAWPESFELDYDGPSLELPANEDDLKKPGYVFSRFVACDEDGKAVSVLGDDGSGNLAVVVSELQPGNVYRVLDLVDADGNPYDVASIKAIWTPRIAIDVPSAVNLGIMADTASDSLKFRYDETSYAGDSADAYAPLKFVSYTTAPVGIVEVADEDAADRAALREEIFRGKQASVSLTLSASKAPTHKLAFGGVTGPVAADGYLAGLRIGAADMATSNPAETVLWLGMDFGNLKAADLELGKTGDIAKLRYTVALLDGDGALVGGTETELAGGFDKEIAW